MPRPRIEEQVRKKVREYLLTAETLSPEEAPLNTQAVAVVLKVDRKTLKKYRLDEEIAASAERQQGNGKLSPKALERRSMNDMLRDRDQENAAMRLRCEKLLALVCLAEGNAKRLGIDPTELWKALVVPDRSLPHTGNRKKSRKRFGNDD